MIPLLHDFSGATVLVFGGGPVGARKARRFAREARVIVVSPRFADEEFGGADRVRAAPGADGVGGWIERIAPALVVAATDDGGLNAAIEAAAREAETLVNRADRHGSRSPASVVVPATVREDPVVVAVSTSGTSPALSRAIRERLEAPLRGARTVAEATAGLRNDLRRRGVPRDRRADVLRVVVRSDAVWEAAREGGDVRERAEGVVQEALSGDPE